MVTRPQKTTRQVLALVRRMRALSAADEDLARLLEELAPHLPADTAAEGT